MTEPAEDELEEIEDDKEEDVLRGNIRVPEVFRGSDKLSIRIGKKPTQSKMVRFVVWNTLTPCRRDECPIFNDCPHEDKSSSCKVEQGYINSVAAMVYRNFRLRFTEDQFFFVGMHILPMYRHLCRFKIWEWAVRDVMYEDDKGKFHLNPIYREVREQVRAISAQWKMLGVGNFQVIEPNNPWGAGGKPEMELRSYYDRLGEFDPVAGRPNIKERFDRIKVVNKKGKSEDENGGSQE